MKFSELLCASLRDVYNTIHWNLRFLLPFTKTICKLSNDDINHVFGYVGEKQYGFVACT
jgi:hypothetical protein